ncbi:MAG: hypothetical protein D3914_16940, partial [Candidatus Electrothrix sp. LOE2]|nr:hypothetical protein [Candidatus Electrothrix sp. LOE2]
IKFRPKTEEHDLNFKIKKIKGFLEKKNKVKVTMQFRGRGRHINLPVLQRNYPGSRVCGLYHGRPRNLSCRLAAAPRLC